MILERIEELFPNHKFKIKYEDNYNHLYMDNVKIKIRWNKNKLNKGEEEVLLKHLVFRITSRINEKKK
jgi:hypothetical protein